MLANKERLKSIALAGLGAAFLLSLVFNFLLLGKLNASKESVGQLQSELEEVKKAYEKMSQDIADEEAEAYFYEQLRKQAEEAAEMERAGDADYQSGQDEGKGDGNGVITTEPDPDFRLY